MKRTSQAEPLEVLRAIWALNRALQRLSAAMESTLGITAQQRYLLLCVERLGTCSPGRLAQELLLDPGTISTSVARLVAAGLLARVRNPEDGRGLVLSLSPLGRRRIARRTGTVEAAVRRMLDGAPPAELRRALRVLERLTGELERERDHRTRPVHARRHGK